tara:strand:+ start:48778 stop:49470 length:693 start_codon:yes stop_codon:yes gene_type:complete
MKVLITGASRGIGYALAKEYCRNGHEVVAIARTSSKLLELEAFSKSNPNYLEIKIYTCDLALDLSCLDEVVKGENKIDVLINNAGMLLNRAFKDISQKELEEVYRLNVFSPFYIIQKLLPFFSSDAQIINIGSVGGVSGSVKFPGLSAYSSSKGALSILTECLQAEFSETDLTFNCLALGAVQTEMLEEAFPGYKADVSPGDLAKYIYNFTLGSSKVQRGQTISVSRSNP